MSEHGRSVCNLRLVSLLRMISGHYSDLGLSPRIQRILKIYCTLAPLLSISINYYVSKDAMTLLNAYGIFESLAHYFVSMYSKSNYMYEYYEFIPIVDGAPRASEMFSKLEKILPWFHVLLLVEGILLVSTSLAAFLPIHFIMKLTDVCYVFAGRIPLVLIFNLLYCRANIFRKNVISSEGRNTRGDGVNNHVLAYTALNENLDKTGWPPMLLLCIQICSWFINVLYLAFETSRFFKTQNYEVDHGRVWIILIVMALDTFLVFYPAIMLELAAEELEQSRIFIADLVVTCTDEAKRSELKELLYFLRHQPLQYRVCHVVPLSARLPLALVVLGANYLVCALQFTNTFGSNSTRANATEKP